MAQQPVQDQRTGARGHRCNSFEGSSSDSSPQCPRSLRPPPNDAANWPVFICACNKERGSEVQPYGRVCDAEGDTAGSIPCSFGRNYRSCVPLAFGGKAGFPECGLANRALSAQFAPLAANRLPIGVANWPVFIEPEARSRAMKDNAMGRLATRKGTQRAPFRAPSVETIVVVSPWRWPEKQVFQRADSLIARSPLSSRQRPRTVRFRATLRTGRFSSRLKQGVGQ